MHAGPRGSVSRVQGLLSPLGPFLYRRGLRAWRGAVSEILPLCVLHPEVQAMSLVLLLDTHLHQAE